MAAIMTGEATPAQTATSPNVRKALVSLDIAKLETEKESLRSDVTWRLELCVAVRAQRL